MNKVKLISTLENLIYSSDDKFEQDNLFKLYSNLIQKINLNKYNVFIEKTNPIKILIKHKAYSKKIKIYFNENKNLFFNNKQIEINNLSKEIEDYFLDKK